MTLNTLTNTLKVAITSIGVGIGYFLGAMDGLFITLVVFLAVDYITGVILAIINKELNSRIGFKGILRKVLLFIIVGIANLIDVNLIQGEVLRTAVISFFMANEGISILENSLKCGIPIPKKLNAILAQLKEESNESD